MRVALYARVSTSNKDQNPETQLLPLWEFAAAQGWTITGECVDHASATDLRGRTAWRALLDQAPSGSATAPSGRSRTWQTPSRIFDGGAWGSGRTRSPWSTRAAPRPSATCSST